MITISIPLKQYGTTQLLLYYAYLILFRMIQQAPRRENKDTMRGTFLVYPHYPRHCLTD